MGYTGYTVGGFDGVGFFVNSMAAILIAFWFGNRPVGWVRHNQWLSAAVVAAWVTAAGLAFWFVNYSKIARFVTIIAMVVAIICFIRHMCLMRNWCQRLNQWWTATAWPAIHAKVTRFTAWVRGPLLRGVNAVAQTIWDTLSFIAQNTRIVHIQWILLIASGYGLYHSIFQGPLWISVWWWAALSAVAVLWISAEARAAVRAVGRRLWRAHVANWNRIPGLWQFALVTLAGGWMCLCFWLLSLWKHRELIAGYDVTLSGIGIVLGVGIVGWILCSVKAGHGPRPLTPAQRLAAARCAARHAAGAHP